MRILTRRDTGLLTQWTFGGSAIDSDAVAFNNAAGITNSTQADAINTLVSSLKSNNLWTKFNAIYPFVGGSASSHKFNLKDPRDLDAAFRLSFVGGWTHSANGALPNGTNGYANTFLNPNAILSLTSSHVSIYSRTLNVGVEVELGAFDGTNFTQLRSAANAVLGSTSSILNFTTTTDARGFWVATKRATNDREAYRNGATQTTVTTNDAAPYPNLNIFLSARNDSGTAAVYSNKQLAFASIGSGLTDAEVTTFNTLVTTFQTTLGRNV